MENNRQLVEELFRELDFKKIVPTRIKEEKVIKYCNQYKEEIEQALDIIQGTKEAILSLKNMSREELKSKKTKELLNLARHQINYFYEYDYFKCLVMEEFFHQHSSLHKKITKEFKELDKFFIEELKYKDK